MSVVASLKPTLQTTDSVGRIIKKIDIKENPKTGVIDLKDIADGIYVIKYEINDNNILTRKLIIQK